MQLKEFIAELLEYKLSDEVEIRIEFDDQEELVIDDFEFSKREHDVRFGKLVLEAKELSNSIVDVHRYEEMSTRLDELESENKDLHSEIEQLNSHIEVLEGV